MEIKFHGHACFTVKEGKSTLVMDPYDESSGLQLPKLSANLVTSLLVTLASSWGLPVSTTHVSAGAVAGLGLRRDARAVEWKTVWSVVQAWVVTLPACAALAGAAWWVLAGWAK